MKSPALLLSVSLLLPCLAIAEDGERQEQEKSGVFEEKRGILVVDTPASAAACAPKGDKRRTGAGLKEFRDLIEAHDAYSKNFFRKLFGR